MIENGNLTYGAINEGILTWRFSNDVLNEIVIAALLTIISYQAVEMLINLSFGMKIRGRARLRDIQIMLLIRKSSPMAILRAIFPWHRKGRKVPPAELVDDMSETDTDAGRGGFRIFSSVYAKLFWLLLAIPLINVGSVVLSLERDKDLTFAEARFGGLACGVDMNKSLEGFSLISRIPKGFCEGVTVQRNTAEFPIALFRSCVRDISPSNDANRNGTAIVAVRSTQSAVAFVSVTIGSQIVIFEKRLLIVSDLANTTSSERNGQLYGVQNKLNISDVQLLVRHGTRLARRSCDDNDETEIEEEIKQGGGVGNFSVARSGECRRDVERSRSEDLKSVNEVARDILSRLSFVDSDEFLVNPDVNGQSRDFVIGDDLLLLSRRRSIVSIPIMAILALAIVLLRVIAQLATNNDLERAIGLIVRDGLGLPCCDSMLCSPDIVAQYDSRGRILYDVDRSYVGPGQTETTKG